MSRARVYGFAVAALFVAAAGCKKATPPLQPIEAYRKLELAIAAGDAGTFFDMLDAPTRKSIEGTWRDQQLQRTIVQAKFPPAEAQAALARLGPAAADDARAYYVMLNKEQHQVEGYRKRIGSVSGPIMTKPENEKSIWVARQDGMPFHFVQAGDGGWWFDMLAIDWALEKDKASHAVTTVRENAKLYEKAGTP